MKHCKEFCCIRSTIIYLHQHDVSARNVAFAPKMESHRGLSLVHHVGGDTSMKLWKYWSLSLEGVQLLPNACCLFVHHHIVPVCHQHILMMDNQTSCSTSNSEYHCFEVFMPWWTWKLTNNQFLLNSCNSELNGNCRRGNRNIFRPLFCSDNIRIHSISLIMDNSSIMKTRSGKLQHPNATLPAA